MNVLRINSVTPTRVARVKSLPNTYTRRTVVKVATILHETDFKTLLAGFSIREISFYVFHNDAYSILILFMPNFTHCFRGKYMLKEKDIGEYI
jgi:hypothetical protein